MYQPVIKAPERLLVAGAFLIKDEKVLLVLRKNTHVDNNCYGLVGGRIESGEPYNKEPDKHGHVEWFPLHNLPPNFLERHKKALELYQQGIYYSAWGW
jgi:ADP-ribose pyrophosphatase YjhB (NUDIX family)